MSVPKGPPEKAAVLELDGKRLLVIGNDGTAETGFALTIKSDGRKTSRKLKPDEAWIAGL